MLLQFDLAFIWGKVHRLLPSVLMGICVWFTLHSGYPVLPGLAALILVIQATT
jgi:hypothetical protein